MSYSYKVITFQGDKLDTLYLVTTLVAGFKTFATFRFREVYLRKTNGPIFGNAQREALARLMKTNWLGWNSCYF